MVDNLYKFWILTKELRVLFDSIDLLQNSIRKVKDKPYNSKTLFDLYSLEIKALESELASKNNELYRLVEKSCEIHSTILEDWSLLRIHHITELMTILDKERV